MTTPLRSSDMMAGVYDKHGVLRAPPAPESVARDNMGCPVHRERATRVTDRLPVPYCTCGNPSCVSLLSKPAKCADCKLPLKALDPQKYATLQDPSGMVGCIQAYCINEHDALPDMERVDPEPVSSPAVSYGGGYASLSTWARNTLLVAAGSVALALLLGIGYLIISGWPYLVAGIRNLSSW